MKIVVCVKQVPDTTEIKINPQTGTLIREGVPSILNPDDASALEAALEIKDREKDAHITVITMGPPQAKDMLAECLAMGADEAVLLSDRALGGSDTWATSNAIAAGIKKIGDYDLILAGRQAIDGDTAQVGPQIAEKLSLPQVTYVKSIEFSEGCPRRRIREAESEAAVRAYGHKRAEQPQIHVSAGDIKGMPKGDKGVERRGHRSGPQDSRTESLPDQRVQVLHAKA